MHRTLPSRPQKRRFDFRRSSSEGDAEGYIGFRAYSRRWMSASVYPPADASERPRRVDFHPKARPPQMIPERRLAVLVKRGSRAIEAQCMESLD